MRNILLFIFCLFLSQILLGQEFQNADTISKPVFDVNKPEAVKDVNVYLDMRFGFLNHFEKGRDDNFSEFRMRHAAIGIYGKLHERVSFSFRNRYNREAAVQTLDMLGGNVEMANVKVKLSPKSDLTVGKMAAFFGGYEYEFNPIEVLMYNDIQDNLLNYVTGVGYEYQVSENHGIGFQATNSRTMRYSDIYEGNVGENVKEPKWPLALVANWSGSFWGGKFETLYSYSRFRVAKGHGTTNSITLGNKFQHKNLVLMYDFNYDTEQLDTKGIITEIIDQGTIASDVTYIEHWLRAEYQFSPHIRGLVTLMTSDAYGKNITGPNSGMDKMRTSYGYVPTIYYQPFKDFDLRFYVAYLGRHFNYSSYAKNELGITNYYTGEVRTGFIAPLWIL